MNQIREPKPRVVFVFNPEGFEGYYVLSSSEAEQDKVIRLIEFMYSKLNALGKEAASIYAQEAS